MKNIYFTIEFGVHVPKESVTSMASSLNYYGNISDKSNDQIYEVEVFREAKAKELKQRLLEWDRYGFLKWSCVEK